MSSQDEREAPAPVVVPNAVVDTTSSANTTTATIADQADHPLKQHATIEGEEAGSTPVDGQQAELDQSSEPKSKDQEMAERHHQAGFSAEAFASYEQRLKTAITRPAPAHPRLSESAATFSTSNASFESASDLEKGELLDEKAPRTTAHSRQISTGTVDTISSVDTLNLAIPDKRQHRVVRNVRHTYLNVYRRLFSIVFIGNIIPLITWLTRLRYTSVNNLNLSDLATAAAVNFCVAILIRQDYIVNFLYRVCWLVPHSAPLRIRRMLAKVYENGGVHSGCAVAGSLWFLLLTIVLSIQFASFVLRSIPVLTLTCVLLVMLFGIIFLACPKYRFFSHNTFEYTHRFAGWSAIGIFWVDAMLIVNEIRKKTGHSFGHEMIRLPTFWILAIITFHLVLPWLRLRKWHFKPDQLSAHALRLNFDKTLPPLSGLAIAESPLAEWHPFATYPKAGGGGCMIISNAGDWTKRTILEPKTRYWVKGLPKTGVLSMAFVFRKVVVVTTGSGIGPCLSFMLEPSRKTDCRVLWSTPAPLKTYGTELYNQVESCDPNALIIDTRVSGRPDMVALTYKLYKESGAEAVFCISNPRLTKKIVYGMESRGVPAFGPIWDS
jgi:hypothetical protein